MASDGGRCPPWVAAFLGHSPDRATADDIRRYQLHLASSGLGIPSVNAAMTALRFFFRVTLRRSDVMEDVVFIREPRRLPVVLSPEEVDRLLTAAPGLKYRAALSIAYGAGLRASEVISLKVGDIDSARMLIRVQAEQQTMSTTAAIRVPGFVPCASPAAAASPAWKTGASRGSIPTPHVRPAKRFAPRVVPRRS
jgi:integrase